MTNDRLASGMTAKEAVSRASAWWDKTGRKLMNAKVNEERGKPRVFTGGNAPALILQGETRATLPSGILQALPWDDLSRREKQFVVKVWHNEYVLKQKQDVHKRLRLDESH